MRYQVHACEQTSGREFSLEFEASDEDTATDTASFVGHSCNIRGIRLPVDGGIEHLARTGRATGSSAALRTNLRRLTLLLAIAFLLAMAVYIAGCEKPTPSPPVPGNLHGGVWVTFRNGDSKVIRGLEIGFVPRGASGEMLQSAVKAMRACATKNKQIAEENPQSLLSPYYAEDSSKWEALATMFSSREAVDFLDVMTACLDHVRGDSDRLKTLDIEASTIWRDLVENVATIRVATDIDGKYQATLPSGESMYIFAVNATSSNAIIWLLEVDVAPGESKELNLSEKNARIVLNR